MRIVVQRSKKSSVKVEGIEVGQIEHGMVLLVCIEDSDHTEIIYKAAEKILKLRIFSDEKGKMNKNLTQVNGSILAISQFTLSWRGQKGNRPSFDRSAKPEVATQLFNQFISLLNDQVPTETGSFGDHMEVSIANTGPVTFVLDF